VSQIIRIPHDTLTTSVLLHSQISLYLFED
jgi:hypothetical protein